MYIITQRSLTEKNEGGVPVWINTVSTWAFTENEARRKGARQLGLTDERLILSLKVDKS